MFGIGLPELIIILIVALLVVGPSKLPEVARTVGRALGEFRRMADDVKESLTQEIDKEDETGHEAPRQVTEVKGEDPYKEQHHDAEEKEASEPHDQKGS